MSHPLTERARELFASDSCQCGALKLGRQEWFCRNCWFKLSDPIRKSLKYLNRDWRNRFSEAMRILENHG